MPDAPTSVPATISKVLSSTYPDAATVRPVNAFSSEITTGTSAPPTGSTNNTPSTNDKPVQTTANGTLDAATAAMPQPTAPRPTSDVTTCAPGTRIGRPVISSCSFAKVISEPVKLTLPTMAVNATAIAAAVESTLCRRTYSSSATNIAAPPPTPLNSATICGIAVILTTRAAGIARAVPTTMAPMMSGRWPRPRCATVTITARTAPNAPMRLPLRAVLGDDNPFSARMKHNDVTKYATSVPVLTSCRRRRLSQLRP